jgi:hypothetical protein
MPLAGMAVIGRVFASLNPAVIQWVSLWMLFGVVYYAIVSKGFRKTFQLTLDE